jgi:hypothetical protein
LAEAPKFISVSSCNLKLNILGSDSQLIIERTSPMNRTATAILSIALAFATVGFGAAPAFANRVGPDYRAVTTASVTGVKVASEVAWRCADNVCVAQAANSRPAIVCAHVAREVGKLESFSFRGEALDADTLAKCNTKAR